MARYPSATPDASDSEPASSAISRNSASRLVDANAAVLKARIWIAALIAKEFEAGLALRVPALGAVRIASVVSMIPGMSRERWLSVLGPALGALAFGVAIFVLHRELAEFRLADVQAHIASISVRERIAAAVLTLASYALLTGYDALAFRWIRNALAYPKIALASFVGFVFSHNIGLSFLGGNAVRYRVLTSYGVPAADVGRVVAFNLITFWLGFLGLGGLALLLDPLALPAALHLPFATTQPLGALLLALLVGYAALCVFRREPRAPGRLRARPARAGLARRAARALGPGLGARRRRALGDVARRTGARLREAARSLPARARSWAW